MQSYPLNSLKEGSWFKLICGASYQHLPAVRSLALVYTLAGADCIDVAADPAVIRAANEGIGVAQQIQNNRHLGSSNLPLLMVSINDGEDPHFRKAQLDLASCPEDCPQPCVRVCPASAIDLALGGVIKDLCYGCGRCEPICPQNAIANHSYRTSLESIGSWIESLAVDAIEIHTQVEHYNDFKRVWHSIAPLADRLKLLAISCTDAPNVIEYLRSLYQLISPLPCPLIWQTDGRSMSGDIGKGTTHETISFANKVLQARLPGYIQLAGGTNNYTVNKLKQTNKIGEKDISGDRVSGIAYGSYARAILAPTIAKLETELLSNQLIKIQNRPMNQPSKLEHQPELLEQAVATATQLVSQIKTAQS